MTNPDVDSDIAPDRSESDPPQFTSLILRCWRGEMGQLRIRLVNVNSGVSHLVADLNELPDLVRRQVAPVDPDDENP